MRGRGGFPATTGPSGRPTCVRWLVLALLYLVSFVPYILRTNMSIAGEAMMKDLGFSELQFGYVLAAFAWGYGTDCRDRIVALNRMTDEEDRACRNT